MKNLVFIAVVLFGGSCVAQDNFGRIANSLERIESDMTTRRVKEANNFYNPAAEIAMWQQQASALYGANMEMQARYYFGVASQLSKQFAEAQKKLDAAEARIKRLEDQMKKFGITPVK